LLLLRLCRLLLPIRRRCVTVCVTALATCAAAGLLPSVPAAAALRARVIARLTGPLITFALIAAAAATSTTSATLPLLAPRLLAARLLPLLAVMVKLLCLNISITAVMLPGYCCCCYPTTLALMHADNSSSSSSIAVITRITITAVHLQLVINCCCCCLSTPPLAPRHATCCCCCWVCEQ
jgi:hypothetical protein